jgi:hypothetical protein
VRAPGTSPDDCPDYLPSPPDPKVTATHEAGHCIVAHAMGLHVIYATITRDVAAPGAVLRKGRPGEHVNATGGFFVSDGFTAIEPHIGEQIAKGADAGLAPTPEQRLWLAQFAVRAAAGPLAQEQAGFSDHGATLDLKQVYDSAKLLSGWPHPDEAAHKELVRAILNSAAHILNGHWSRVEVFAEHLLKEIELEEQMCQEILGSVPLGRCLGIAEALASGQRLPLA